MAKDAIYRSGGKDLTSKVVPLAFLTARLILFLSLPLEGIRSFGDYWDYTLLAKLGWPFWDIWVEYPPLFPFLSRLLFQLAGGRPHSYEYLLALLFSVAQAGNLYLFLKLAEKIHPPQEMQQRGMAYFALLIGLFYGWAYFDPLAVMALLLGLYWLLTERDIPAALALGLGALTKWFPILALAAVWKWRPPHQALKITLIALGIITLAWGGLYALSPEMTKASLASQGAKGSWETVWALIDGNIRTGNFGPDADRTLPPTAYQPIGNPPRLSSWATLIIFAALGLWAFLRLDLKTELQIIAFVGLTLVIFLLWSPGYSPQWTLYLLPLILLVIPGREGILLGLVFVLINLLEWPILLSRGYFWSLWLIIPLRTLLLGLIGMRFWQISKDTQNQEPVSDKIIQASL